MSDAKIMSLRLRQELIDRLDALLPHLDRDPRLQSVLGRCTRSDVARVALVAGIEKLEDQYLSAEGDDEE